MEEQEDQQLQEEEQLQEEQQLQEDQQLQDNQQQSQDQEDPQQLQEQQEQEQEQEQEQQQQQQQQTSPIKSHARPYDTDDAIEGTGFFDDYLYRQTAWSGLIFLFSILSIGRMFHKAKAPDCGYSDWHEHYRSISAGFLMSGIGLSAILIGSLVVIILSVMRRRMCGVLLCILLCIGSLVYIIGSWLISAEVPYIYCAVGSSSAIFGGYACIYFGEFFLIGSLSILLGLDLWNDRFLNNFKLRMILTLSCIGFASLIVFFGYAILANYLFRENEPYERAMASDYALTAAGWFFIFICMLIYVAVLTQVKKSIIYSIVSFVLMIATLLCAIGYWAMYEVGEEFDNAYFVAMSFFLLGTGIVLAVDMSFGQYIKKYVLKR